MALTFADAPSLKEVVAAAPLAFQGQVTRVDFASAPVNEQTSIPYTNITLRVEQAFAGAERGDEVTLRQIGGPVRGKPDLFMIVPGLVDLRPSERVYVFADDRKQPFFATLYGDFSLLRIARDDAGLVRVLTAQWQHLRSDRERLRTVPGVFCRPDTEALDRCRNRTVPVFDRSDPEAPAPETRDLTPEIMDALIRSWRAAGPGNAGPGQTVSAERATFEAALGELGRRGVRGGDGD